MATNAAFLRAIPPKPLDLANRNPPKVYWKPLTQPLFKVNFDGVVFNDVKKAGTRVVIQDNMGLVLASMSYSVPLANSVVMVEAIVVVKALTFAKDIGLHFIVLEGDLELIINSLKSKDISFAAYGHLIKEAKYFASSIVVYSFSHTKRLDNFVAHHMARHVSNYSVWMKDVPPHLNAVLVADYD